VEQVHQVHLGVVGQVGQGVDPDAEEEQEEEDGVVAVDVLQQGLLHVGAGVGVDPGVDLKKTL
jgi:hypothetical protein